MARMLNGFESREDAARGLDQVFRRLQKTRGVSPGLKAAVEEVAIAARKEAAHGISKKARGIGSGGKRKATRVRRKAA